MKEKVRREYYRRIRAILKTELNSKNRIIALNTLATPVVQYSFNILNWNLAEIRRMDVKTRKLLTSHRMHHPKADVDRLYLPRKEGGRGMTNLELAYKTTTISLQTYLHTSMDWMMKLVETHETKKRLHSVIKQSKIFEDEYELDETEQQTSQSATKIAKKRKVDAKRQGLLMIKDRWLNKPLHGKYPTRTQNENIEEQGKI